MNAFFQIIYRNESWIREENKLVAIIDWRLSLCKANSSYCWQKWHTDDNDGCSATIDKEDRTILSSNGNRRRVVKHNERCACNCIDFMFDQCNNLLDLHGLQWEYGRDAIELDQSLWMENDELQSLLERVNEQLVALHLRAVLAFVFDLYFCLQVRWADHSIASQINNVDVHQVISLHRIRQHHKIASAVCDLWLIYAVILAAFSERFDCPDVANTLLYVVKFYYVPCADHHVAQSVAADRGHW